MERIMHTVCGAELWRHETGGLARIVRYADDAEREIDNCPRCGENLFDAHIAPAPLPPPAKRRGGARRGAGRTGVDIQLDLESGQTLKLLVLARGMPYTQETRDRLVAELIAAAGAIVGGGRLD